MRVFSIDIETTGLEANSEITTVAIYGGITKVFNAPFDETKVAEIAQILSDPDALYVAHNAIFDFGRLGKLGLPVPDRIWCTLQMARLLHPEGVKGYALFQVAEALGIAIEDEHRKMKARNRSEMKRAASQASLFDSDPYLERYALFDAELAFKIYGAQQALVLERDAELIEWEMRAVRTFARMTARGVCVDLDYADALLQKTKDEIRDALKTLQNEGLRNPNRRGDIRDYLLRKGVKLPEYHPSSLLFTAKAHEALKPIFDSGKKPDVTIEHLSFGAEALDELTRELPELADLKRYNELRFYEAQLENLIESACEGRLHPLYNFTFAGRRATEHPQLQNLNMAHMRGVLIASPTNDAALVEFDLSNAENWMAAMMSADSRFAAACASGDFHTAMARVYFKDEFNTAESSGDTGKLKELRQRGKGITFGMAYGMGAQTMSTRLKMPIETAKAILNQVRSSFPALTTAKEKARDNHDKNGYTVLWSGRRVAGGSAKDAWNYTCQGGVAEITKRAAVLIDEFLTNGGFKSYLALDIHDALIVAVYQDEAAAIVERISELIEGVVPQWWNQRTMPNVRWIARPDFDKNKEKWGFRQVDIGELVKRGELPIVEESEARQSESDFDLEAWLNTPVSKVVELGYPMFNILSRPIRNLRDSVELFKELDRAIEALPNELIALPIPNTTDWRDFKRDQARVLAGAWIQNYRLYRNPEMPLEFFETVIKRLDAQDRVVSRRKQLKAEYEKRAAKYKGEVAEIVAICGVEPNGNQIS